MSFRNISAWSIRNPVPSLVLFFMLTVAGLVSFATMQVNNDPDIDFPVVIVSAQGVPKATHVKCGKSRGFQRCLRDV